METNPLFETLNPPQRMLMGPGRLTRILGFIRRSHRR